MVDDLVEHRGFRCSPPVVLEHPFPFSCPVGIEEKGSVPFFKTRTPGRCIDGSVSGSDVLGFGVGGTHGGR